MQDIFKNIPKKIIREHPLLILQAILCALFLPPLAIRLYTQGWQSSGFDYLTARSDGTMLYGGLTCFACLSFERNILIRCAVTAIVSGLFYCFMYYFAGFMILTISISISMVTPSKEYSIGMKFALRIIKLVLVVFLLSMILHGGEGMSESDIRNLSYGLVWLSVLYDGIVYYFRKCQNMKSQKDCL